MQCPTCGQPRGQLKSVPNRPIRPGETPSYHSPVVTPTSVPRGSQVGKLASVPEDDKELAEPEEFKQMLSPVNDESYNHIIQKEIKKKDDIERSFALLGGDPE